MGIALPKKNQSFRLSVELIDRLRQLAKLQNRSLNNYVETLLLDAAYCEPNEITLAAMKETQSGSLRNTAPLDLSSVEAMERSMGLWKKLHPTTQFKRDYKRFRNNPKKLEKLMVILNMLQSEIPIPAEYYPHMLTGNYAGFMECHIEGDFLLIWFDHETDQIDLVRLGSHSELFKQ